MTRFANILETAAMKRVSARLANEDRALLNKLRAEQEAAAIVEEPDPRTRSRRGRPFLVKR